MDNIKISFIIPCHNLENYIKPLIHSLRSLDLTNISYECIFILDDCTDKTLEVLASEKGDLICHIYECKVHSCGLARNVGLKYAKGEYIWFLDGDDWIIYPYVVKDCIKILEENNSSIIKITYISNFFKMKCDSMVWQYICKRDLIGNTIFKEIQPNEDYFFMKEIFSKMPSNQVFNYNIPSYFYNYKRPGSNMSQFFENGKIQP